MTSSGKIRIYELSKDLSLDNKDVLDAARKLAIAAKSHSSSISSLEANKIKDFLKIMYGNIIINLRIIGLLRHSLNQVFSLSYRHIVRDPIATNATDATTKN